MTNKKLFDLSQLEWTLGGYTPTSWSGRSMEMGFALEPEIPDIKARAPGSVQQALRDAGILPDWFEGLNSRACEWVENRDWLFSAKLPDTWFADGKRFVLRCGGLDGNGLIVFNRKKVATFDNAYIPYEVDLTAGVQATKNEIHFVFTLPPRWLGQVGFTSRMKDWKPRFNYTWDWIPRLVQIGPWEPISLCVSEGASIDSCRVRSDWNADIQKGALWLQGELAPEGAQDVQVQVTIDDGEKTVGAITLTPEAFTAGQDWDALAVEPWWPNGAGEQKLYGLKIALTDSGGDILDTAERTVGFKHVEWRACENAPEGADPWVCVVNGTPVFLQGVDWTPIRPTFADLTREDYEQRITLYRDLGCNIFRVWGGAYLEKEWFYDLCDRLGLLVWQEFPLSSSGHENWPHEDEPSMAVLVETARSYIHRRQHHASLLMWCGGNELQGSLDGSKVGIGKPVTMDHPLMQRWGALVEAEDPGRRFMPASSSGPRFLASDKDFGKGLHWDVHGPWRGPGPDAPAWEKYWRADDALFRSEMGAPGASSAALIRRYSGGLPVMPATMDNPLWRRFAWWHEWKDYLADQGREPTSLEEYVVDRRPDRSNRDLETRHGREPPGRQAHPAADRDERRRSLLTAIQR